MSDNDDESRGTLMEFLPRCKCTVDLLHPESLTIFQLKELFERRGLGFLISKDEPFHRVVDLYYDHLMPIPVRCASPTLGASAPKPSTTEKVRLSTTSCTSPIRTVKRKADVRLEDIVITSDPNRLTPGVCEPSSVYTEHTLSVKLPSKSRKLVSEGLPDSPNVNDHHSNRIVSNQPNQASENHSQANPDSQAFIPNKLSTDSISVRRACTPVPSSKKRVKLRRDFATLSSQ
ncbi:unnamed protein product [Calicophoron daubneyi]|uniref:Ashwin n=1 Tax=Calicophoron daubneyi TaxID=300641 RepID=A0AAV2SY97_CALDB